MKNILFLLLSILLISCSTKKTGHENKLLEKVADSLSKDEYELVNDLLDPPNNFQNIVTADPLINSLQEVFSNLAWYGLESTENYNNLTGSQIINIEHTNLRVRQYYNQNCN